jgi:MarR family transcriptional regulator, organic hydroperoxide resistance regulator
MDMEWRIKTDAEKIFAYTNISAIFVSGMKVTESKYRHCIYFASNALARKTEKLALQSWKKVNLSPSHGYLLMLVLDQPGIQPGIISEHLHLTPSTITRLIEKLEDKKLLVRTTEGKITNVHPTPKAKELMPDMIQCVEDFNKSYISLLGKEESARLVSHITKIADKLED